MTQRRLLLAGSVGPERIPARPDPHYADWYLPLHLRDQSAARGRIAAQIAAGADVVVAPTWLTHRRALLPLGETRRAAPWTAAAVHLGREALELGLERREELSAPDAVQAKDRPTPLLAATLPGLDDGTLPGEGRLPPHEAATERDYREQAGVLADAEPDLILVEGQSNEPETRVAMAEAAATGLPTWLALSHSALATCDLEEWLESSHACGVTRLLVPGPAAERTAAADGPVPWGTLEADPASVGEWLDHGAGAVARLDGASTNAVTTLRAALDEYERPLVEAAGAAEGRWQRAVEQAAAVAPGGAALWLGTAPSWTLPDGFDWLVVGPSEARHLPRGHYRLVVDSTGEGSDLALTLERSGVLVERTLRPRPLRCLTLDDTAQPPIATYRRED